MGDSGEERERVGDSGEERETNDVLCLSIGWPKFAEIAYISH